MGVVVEIDFGRTAPITLSKKELALRLRRSTRWVEMRVRDGMPSHMDGIRRKYSPGVVETWLAENGFKNLAARLASPVAQHPGGPPIRRPQRGLGPRQLGQGQGRSRRRSASAELSQAEQIEVLQRRCAEMERRLIADDEPPPSIA